MLRFSAESRQNASALLHGLIRRQPLSADGWHVLGDLRWNERDMEQALLCFRIASCQATSNEHYALAYGGALARNHREEESFFLARESGAEVRQLVASRWNLDQLD